VWALQDHDLLEALNSTTEPDAKRWFFALMDLLSPYEFTQELVTLWTIWYPGRRALHEHVFQSPLATHLLIKRYLREPEDYKPKKPVRVAVASRAHG
jgi:hypothetical protein